MMSIFDEVVVNAKNAAGTVGKKANQLLDISKLRVSASELNAEVNKKYKELGSVVYEQCKAGAENTAKVSALIEEIDTLYARLEAVNGEITTRRNKKKCAVCGAELEKNATYCSVCGTKAAGAKKSDSSEKSADDTEADE